LERSCGSRAFPRRTRRPYHSSMAAEAYRTRLDPSVFRLPVERIREGYYSDAYFNHTKKLLEEEGHCPAVTMQVFQKQDSVLGGIDEAIAILKECSGRHVD
jgi:nicotinate phosphoribosyltransferase